MHKFLGRINIPLYSKSTHRHKHWQQLDDVKLFYILSSKHRTPFEFLQQGVFIAGGFILRISNLKGSVFTNTCLDTIY